MTEGRSPDAVQHAADPAGTGTLVLERYRLGRRLGSGGFGTVWLAQDEHLHRAVAIKTIPAHDPATLARAEREARAAARLAHPSVVALYEAGADDDAVHLVSELVRGRTLADLLAAGELADRDVLAVGAALCDALAHAHARGVVHRDVKPGNVIVPDDPAAAGAVAKLTDFGIASIAEEDPLTEPGDVVGTIAYMAPEQAEGHEAGEEADLYSLGLVLFEALAGTNPVRAPGAAATARNVGRPLPPLAAFRDDLDPDLLVAVDRAVDVRPGRRGDLLDLREALLDALEADPGEDPGLLGRAADAPLLRRRRRRIGGRVGGALAAAALAGAGALWWEPHPAPAAVGVVLAVVLVLPRLGWLAAAAAAVAWAAQSDPDRALALAAALAPVPLLLRRAPALWSVPALAPLLATAGVGAVWAAVAGQPRRWPHRLGLALAGGWWAALWPAQELAPDPALLVLAAAWTAGALLLPLLVRGRALGTDVLGVVLWAAALATACEAAAPGSGIGAVPAALTALLLAARAERADP